MGITRLARLLMKQKKSYRSAYVTVFFSSAKQAVVFSEAKWTNTRQKPLVAALPRTSISVQG